MKRIIVTGVNEAKIGEEKAPEPKENELLIAVKACGLCTTEISWITGKVPFPTSYGVQPPIILGHEPSGVVMDVGPNVVEFKRGDRVTWPGKEAFSEYCTVSEDRVLRLPDQVSFVEGLGEPLMCAIYGVFRSNVHVGDKCLVLGAGFNGQLIMQGLKVLGAEKVIISDFVDGRLRIAESLGADVTVNPSKQDLKSVVNKETKGEGVDLVVDATGNVKALNESASYVKPGGTLSFFSYFGKEVLLDQLPWMMKDLMVYSPCVAYKPLAVAMQYMRLAIRWTAKKTWKVKPLITVLPMERFIEGVIRTQKQPEKTLKVVFTWE